MPSRDVSGVCLFVYFDEREAEEVKGLLLVSVCRRCDTTKTACRDRERTDTPPTDEYVPEDLGQCVRGGHHVRHVGDAVQL